MSMTDDAAGTIPSTIASIPIASMSGNTLSVYSNQTGDFEFYVKYYATASNKMIVRKVTVSVTFYCLEVPVAPLSITNTRVRQKNAVGTILVIDSQVPALFSVSSNPSTCAISDWYVAEITASDPISTSHNWHGKL